MNPPIDDANYSDRRLWPRKVALARAAAMLAPLNGILYTGRQFHRSVIMGERRWPLKGGAIAAAYAINPQSRPSGAARTFTRTDLEKPVTREFCGECGTHLVTRSPGLADAVIVKVGTLDEPSVFNPGLVIWASEKQWFHHIPEGVAVFDGFPPTRGK